MQSSDQGNELTKQREGLRLAPYLDCTGKGTIGYGHLILPGENFEAGITQDEADQLFAIDKAKADAIVDRECAVQIAAGAMSQGEFDALSDAVFNLGDFLKGSTLLRLLAAGDKAGAEQQLTRWDFAGGKANAGLEARRVAEMELWSKG
jgi:lysozyme